MVQRVQLRLAVHHREDTGGRVVSDSEVHVIANDLPYKATDLDPFRALHNALAFSSNDWGSARDFAWIYGIVCGWDDDDPMPGEDGQESMRALVAKFGWNDLQVARLRALHLKFKAAAEGWKP
jgi:hypothetical protein